MSSYTFQRDFRGFLNFVTFSLVLEQCQAYEKNPLLQLYKRLQTKFKLELQFFRYLTKCGSAKCNSRFYSITNHRRTMTYKCKKVQLASCYN